MVTKENLQNIESKLSELLPVYAEANATYNSAKKEADKLGAEIKALMAQADIKKFDYGTGVASYSVSERTSFNEELLVSKVKELGHAELIRTREYIDEEELESALYNNKIDPAQLAPCQITKTLVSLRLSKKK